MQVILYHNQSGEAAFTGDLKQKEVHRAITLHPVKQPESMYRLDKYVKVSHFGWFMAELVGLRIGLLINIHVQVVIERQDWICEILGVLHFLFRLEKRFNMRKT